MATDCLLIALVERPGVVFLALDHVRPNKTEYFFKNITKELGYLITFVNVLHRTLQNFKAVRTCVNVCKDLPIDMGKYHGIS